MFEDYGYVLSLDTMKSVAKTSVSTAGTKTPRRKPRAPPCVVTWNCETFEREVKTVMNDCGITDNMVAYRIERHRDELLERRDEKRTVTRWTPTAVPGDMSDKDIISLFSALRDE